MERVKSTSVESVDYNELLETLDVKFRKGSPYRYYGVPEETWKELLAAPSVGQFVNFRIKPYFPYKKIDQKFR